MNIQLYKGCTCFLFQSWHQTWCDKHLKLQGTRSFPGSLNILLLPRQQHIPVWQVVTHKYTLVLGYTTSHQARLIPRPSPQLREAWEWGYCHYRYVSRVKDWAGTLTIGYLLENNPQSLSTSIFATTKLPFSGRYNIQWAIPRVPPYGWQSAYLWTKMFGMTPLGQTVRFTERRHTPGRDTEKSSRGVPLLNGIAQWD